MRVKPITKGMIQPHFLRFSLAALFALLAQNAQANPRAAMLGVWYEIAASSPLSLCASGTMVSLASDGKTSGASLIMGLDCVSTQNKLLSAKAAIDMPSAQAWSAKTSQSLPAQNWADLASGRSEILFQSKDANTFLLWHSERKQARILARRPFLTEQELIPMLTLVQAKGMKREQLRFTSHQICSTPQIAASAPRLNKP
jgi:lipocalin